MVRLETGIDFLQAQEALEQETRANQQRKRERHFSDHQQTAQPLSSMTFRSRAGAFFERFIQIRPRGLQRWRQTENEAAQQRCQHSKAQHPPIEIDFLQAREVRGAKRTEKINAPESQEQPNHAANSS